jgi:hypothetical protein
MSKIEVNTVEPQCGTTLTLGGSGDTVALGCGASQTGFGRTGTVDWVTTPKVTGDSPITAVTGEGYFLNTTAGTITINLPAGAAGSIVSMADYAATWQTNAVTVSPNGTDKIGGTNTDVDLTTEGQSVTFVYVDSTQGWVNTMDSTSNVRANEFIVATGGTISCSGDYKIHTFTGPGTFTVSEKSGIGANNIVSYMVVAGGAGGGYERAGGGGAGGFREYKGPTDSYTASPLDGNPGGTAITVTATDYPITVGGGGAGRTSSGSTGTSGSNSVFSSITSAGGGGGGSHPYPGGCANLGLAGGSGGGVVAVNLPAPTQGGAGNTPSTTPSQGNPAGATCTTVGSAYYYGSSGGGATAAGSQASGSVTTGTGGAGATTSISATPTAYAGGGGGGGNTAPQVQPGGAGGGGAGGKNGTCAANATVNTGGGGGGGNGQPGTPYEGGDGGSGIVVIRYKFQ